MKPWSKVLTIAGSDSGGGAGIQADIKAISANQAYAASVVTSITAQNTVGVQAVEPVSTEMIDKQLQSVCGDIEFDAVKIGLLANVDTVLLVANWCQRMTWRNVVVDPVMIAQSGDKLACDDTSKALMTELMPQALLITPNIPEAESLLAGSIKTRSDMQHAAQALSRQLSVAVLLKGGHLDGAQCVDVLVENEQETWFESARIETTHTHGTGCSLSSAIAALLARGFSLQQSVQQAHDYCHQAIVHAASQQLGQGAGPIAHFYSWWD